MLAACRLGARSVAFDASSPGHDLSAFEATVKLAKVSPVGDLKPVITASVGRHGSMDVLAYELEREIAPQRRGWIAMVVGAVSSGFRRR